MAKINPFDPNSPVHAGMFVGRVPELIRSESCLVQTKAGSPSNFMLTGERGIGKSSLLNYIKSIAEGDEGRHCALCSLPSPAGDRSRGPQRACGMLQFQLSH